MADLPFHSIRLSGLRALKDCKLTRLGRVNVICGRNNSGKSTLLQALVNPSTRFPGAIVDSSRGNELFSALRESTGWRQSAPGGIEDRILRNIVDAELEDARVLYLNESTELTSAIKRRFSEHRQLSQWAFSADGVSKLFARWMGNNHNSVLVSPKRRLETRRAVNASEGITESGAGILNFLFFAKNQPVSSSEWKTYSRIAAEFTAISNGYSFDVFINQANELDLRFAQPKGVWVAADDCGLGLQDLLVLLYFSVAPGFSIIAVEEPENHLHPDMQRRLLGFFKQCSDRQFFISTHSNVFLNNVYVDRVFFTTFRDEVRVVDATSRASMLDDLGYSVADNLVSDVVVLVEGPTDTPVVEELLLKKGVLPQYDVKFWPLAGC